MLSILAISSFWQTIMGIAFFCIFALPVLKLILAIILGELGVDISSKSSSKYPNGPNNDTDYYRDSDIDI